MLELSLYVTGLGLIDSVNPASIGFLIFLFPLLRRPIEGFWYVGGTFVTYLAVGFGLHLGLAAILETILGSIPLMAWLAAELAAGLGLVALGTFLWSRAPSKKTGKPPLSVGPIALFLLGASNTVFDLPTSLPYLSLLGRLAAIGAGPLLALPLLAAYNLVYIAPMLALQIAYLVLRERIGPAMARLSAFLDRADRALMIGFPILAGLALAADAAFRLPVVSAAA